jgi:hypothetical protein
VQIHTNFLMQPEVERSLLMLFQMQACYCLQVISATVSVTYKLIRLRLHDAMLIKVFAFLV